MNGADWAAMSDPDRNPQFRRGWTWPPPRNATGPRAGAGSSFSAILGKDKRHSGPVRAASQGQRIDPAEFPITAAHWFGLTAESEAA